MLHSKSVSTFIDQCLRLLPKSVLEGIANIDRSTVFAVQIGITLGLVVVTFLSFFPGKPSGIQHGDDSAAEQKAQEEKMINPTQQEKIQKMFGLSENQMKEAIHTARKQQQDGDYSAQFSFARKIDFVVYGALVSLFVYIVNRDYDSAFTKWFIATFPREADTLGIALRP